VSIQRKLKKGDDMIPVEGHKNLFRDENTGAILNTDSSGYSNYMSQKRINLDKQSELDSMKKEIEELKLMLNELASKITS
tara:strand:- start:264 stop:503 length:240 start_codon:yes stop_codon:yes gene_type:complete